MPTKEQVEAMIPGLLVAVEELFGPKNATIELLPLEFENVDRPKATRVNNTQVRITLPVACLEFENDSQAMSLLAHELIHAIGPGDGGPTKKLEEGCADYFSVYIIRKRFGLTVGPPAANYIEALDLFKQLMTIDPILVKSIRLNKAAFSSITPADLTGANAGFPQDLADAITATFVY